MTAPIPERISKLNTCSNCRYFENVASSLILTGQKANICHRYPPDGFLAPMQISTGQMAMQMIYRHAEVKPDDYCGEWQTAETDNLRQDQSPGEV